MFLNGNNEKSTIKDRKLEGYPDFSLFFLVRVHKNILNLKSEYYFNRVSEHNYSSYKEQAVIIYCKKITSL